MRQHTRCHIRARAGRQAMGQWFAGWKGECAVCCAGRRSGWSCACDGGVGRVSGTSRVRGQRTGPGKSLPHFHPSLRLRERAQTCRWPARPPHCPIANNCRALIGPAVLALSTLPPLLRRCRRRLFTTARSASVPAHVWLGPCHESIRRHFTCQLTPTPRALVYRRVASRGCAGCAFRERTLLLRKIVACLGEGQVSPLVSLSSIIAHIRQSPRNTSNNMVWHSFHRIGKQGLSY